MRISKTQISKRLKKKTNTKLVETIKLANKNNLLQLGKILSGPNKLHSKVNLDELNELKETKILIVGKVLGKGNIKKKIEIAALGFSESAKEKLEKAGCKTSSIKKYLEHNKDLKGIKVI